MPLVQPTSVVKGTPVNVNDLFKNFNYIPVYQRDFVWQGKQVKALWNDLIDHYKQYADANEDLIRPEGYFLGAMVVIDSDDDKPFEVVDGQQRLTSLTTIAAICYDALASQKNPDGRIQSWKTQLGGLLAQPEAGDFVPKLTFSDEEISKFFFESTFKRRSREEKELYWNEQWCKDRLSRRRSPFSKMKEAITVGYKELDIFLAKTESDEKRVKRLISFVQLLVEGVIILRIRAMSYTNAYAIFESLNNRGIPLSQSDLIKNEILKTCSQADLDDVAESWQSARQTIESIEMISMPDFVHFSFISRYGAVKANKLYDRVKSITSTSALAKQYAVGLATDAQALEGVTDSFDAAWKQETMYMLKDIKNVLNVRHCYPYLITAFRAHSENPKTFHDHVEAVLNFAFRYMKVLEDPLENFTAAIGKACELIEAGKPVDEIRGLFQTYAPDDIFIKRFEEASFTNTKLAYFTVYYLEKVRLGGTNPCDHGVDQNLEHIMPKTPTSAHWPKAALLKEESSATYRDYLWRVGNLIPLTANINKSLKNKSIALKIKDPSGLDYTSGNHSLLSPLTIESYLDNGEWNYSSIEARQRDLARNWAAKAWPL
ncbi:DUF262 domain-containing protein [Hydrogenophaga sp. IBVHS2]|uniref:DUF262 domain-containing protein n=1 Tax=Hydrogenophaga sp. IBVHS2 TaxID=1985170 RepID=UPI000A2D41F8|nr:DUF262 domain-containing protein [Hydrogenophaga sp. IBVHS2]OSZ63310.1 hypothetical protein CAP38_12505 [Hydrogenophaga sp. IBVHS2]